MSEEEIREVVTTLDRDGNDSMSEEEIRKVFTTLDRDSNGSISAAELRYFFSSSGEMLTDEEVDNRIREMDIDGDGQINCEEFITGMMST